jgi:hypothetical protein
MLTLYLMCLAAGGALLVYSLAGGGDTDTDVDTDVSTDVDGADADVSGADADAADAAEAGGEAEGEGTAAVARFLSVRSLVFFTAFFGLTGTLLTLLRADVVPALAASLLLGVGAALVVQRSMLYLKRSESGALRSLTTLAGARARVLVAVSRARPGKVSIVTADNTEQFLARVHDGAAAERFEPGDTVVIVRFQDGVALVAEPSFLR